MFCEGVHFKNFHSYFKAVFSQINGINARIYEISKKNLRSLGYIPYLAVSRFYKISVAVLNSIFGSIQKIFSFTFHKNKNFQKTKGAKEEDLNQTTSQSSSNINKDKVKKKKTDDSVKVENPSKSHSPSKPLQNYDIQQIKWLSGSRSASIAIMINKRLLDKIGHPALASTKTLLDFNIAPLTGETYWVGNTISGVALSDLYWALHYAKDPCYIHNFENTIENIFKITIDHQFNIDYLKLSVLRLLLAGARSEEYPSIKKHITEKILEKIKCDFKLETVEDCGEKFNIIEEAVPIDLISHVKKSDGFLKKGQIVGYFIEDDTNKTKILNFGMVSSRKGENQFIVITHKNGFCYSFSKEEIFVLDETKLQTALNSIKSNTLESDQIEAIKWSMLSDKEKVYSILNLFDTTTPMQFTEEQETLFKLNFPIIWASNTLNSIPVEGIMGRAGERYLTKPAFLGKNRDIQTVFVESIHIEKVHKVLKDYEIEVRDITLLEKGDS